MSEAGKGPSYTGLPWPSQCSSSFWPSRGWGGSGLIFAVGVSAGKETASTPDPHHAEEVAQPRSVQGQVAASNPKCLGSPGL